MLIVSPLAPTADEIEIVERKGLGHPDTICDALAETLSRNLCREYRRRFGEILHHNVDKALLRGGKAVARFGGGRVLAPIEIYLAGRVTNQIGNEIVETAEIAVEGTRAWLGANLHALDALKHVRIHPLMQSGSHDLQALFSRRSPLHVPLANDTSIGVGYAPLSPLEKLVLVIDKRITERNHDREHLVWGEDVKVMAVRQGRTVSLTVACAMIGGYLKSLADYLEEKSRIQQLVQGLAAEHGFEPVTVAVNAADDLPAESIYLTVTGTSAEAGDDGQVGRGNRVNGLITPCRPMSLEAAAGKNPVNHVGKIYNVIARELSESVVTQLPQVTAAHCFLVSQIGAPVTSPSLVHVRLETRDGLPPDYLKARIEEIADCHLSGIPKLFETFAAGTIEIY